MLDVGCGMLDVRCWVWDVGCGKTGEEVGDRKYIIARLNNVENAQMEMTFKNS